MAPSTTSGPRRARRPRARKTRTYNIAGVIELRETGVLEAAERIMLLAERVSDPETIKAAAPAVYKAVERLFENHGSGQWKATKPETTAEKRRKGLRTEPMRATDKLYQTLTRPPSELPAGMKSKGILSIRKRNTELRVGSKMVEGVMQKRAGRDALIVDEAGRRDVVAVLTRQLLS
jgi:hypothetical protein